MSNLKETVVFLEKVNFFGGLKRRQLENLAKRMVGTEIRHNAL